jgi:hypothetical protein
MNIERRVIREHEVNYIMYRARDTRVTAIHGHELVQHEVTRRLVL